MNTELNAGVPAGTAALGHTTFRDERINILIVDDEPKNLTVLETVLDDPTYRLVRAESADQALLALVVEEFTLIILDIRMPGTSGFELAQMIKQRKKTARVPIIFLTAYYNEDQHMLAGYETGAVDYLHKPVNPGVLRSKVAVFAELHSRNREIAIANRALLAEVAERRLAERRLEHLNEVLEERVAERTHALREADRRKDEFLATLAHELRNPLAPVRNAVQVLQMEGVTAEQLQMARDVIERQVLQMTRLIDDLLDLSRINEDKMELTCEPVELSKTIQGAIETSRPIIDEFGHTLTVTLPAEPIMLQADATRLTQVFLNLLNNAAKFSERCGSIHVTAEQHGSEVIVSVIDSGIGIPADKLEAVFSMFSQLEGTITRSQGGLGIGLCLVKRLVNLHGGSIEARSDGPGQGSEFVVRLPIMRRSPPLPSNRADNTKSEPTPSTHLRILVVDDNLDAAASLAMLLETMGNTIYIAHDGLEAVAVAREQRPDVVLLDIGLPKMNGYDVARTIRQEPWGRDVVLIAITGWGQEEDRKKADAAGFDRHLVKPADPPALMKLLAEFQFSRV